MRERHLEGYDMGSDHRLEIVAEREGRGHSRVTVTVSLYHYRDFIVSCLESVRAQTISELDLVIVDDCSTDGGGDAARQWLDANGDRFNRYALLRHRKNSGLAAARNTAFAHAQTEYVFVLDADNLLYPRCLHQLMASLDNCAASFAYSYLEKFGAATGLHNLSVWNPVSFQHDNTIDAMVLMRKSIWEAVGGYSTAMPVAGWEDFDLWFKIAHIKGWGIQVPEILGRYCVHRDSMLGTVTQPNTERLWEYLRTAYPEFFGTRTISEHLRCEIPAIPTVPRPSSTPASGR